MGAGAALTAGAVAAVVMATALAEDCMTAGAGAAVVMATALAEDCMLAEPAGTMTGAS